MSSLLLDADCAHLIISPKVKEPTSPHIPTSFTFKALALANHGCLVCEEAGPKGMRCWGEPLLQ